VGKLISYAIKPCDTCRDQEACEVPALIRRIRHPWSMLDIEYDRVFMETVRAEIKDNGLHVVLQCSRFVEAKNA